MAWLTIEILASGKMLLRLRASKPKPLNLHPTKIIGHLSPTTKHWMPFPFQKIKSNIALRVINTAQTRNQKTNCTTILFMFDWWQKNFRLYERARQRLGGTLPSRSRRCWATWQGCGGASRCGSCTRPLAPSPRLLSATPRKLVTTTTSLWR